MTRPLTLVLATTRRGSSQSRQLRATVISDWRPSICIAPSPMKAIAGRSGWANLAAAA